MTETCHHDETRAQSSGTVVDMSAKTILQVQISLTNEDDEDKIYTFSDQAEPLDSYEQYYQDGKLDQGALYRALRSEYGRCTGKIYQDIKREDGTYEAKAVGWHFVKREQYGWSAHYEGDGPTTYLQGAWVSLRLATITDDEYSPVYIGGAP